jgi:hypothetical protein
VTRPIEDGTLRKIVAEILDALPNENDRRDRARVALEYYDCEWKLHPPRPPAERWDADRIDRCVPFVQAVVDKLSEPLYKRGPARSIVGHEAAGAWLADVYAKLHVNATIREADRLSMLGDVCAVQVTGDDDPACPVRLQLWDASSFAVWTDPDDPCRAVAVVTIDQYDGVKRARLWTDAGLWTFVTEQSGTGNNATSGGRTYRYVSDVANPFGIIPFAFVHFKPPSLRFWTPGPGDGLVAINRYINTFLTDTADSIRYQSRPILTAYGVGVDWEIQNKMRPGAVWRVPRGREGSPEPRLEFLSPDLGFIASGWSDLNELVDFYLTLENIPPAAFRMTQTGASSGLQVVAESMPIVEWAAARQDLFAGFEDRLARVVFAVAAWHLTQPENAEGRPDYPATAAQLDAAAAAPALTLRWSSLKPELTGKAADDSDYFEVDNGLASRLEIVMRRRQITRAEALDVLRQIADDAADLAALEPPPPPGLALANAAAAAQIAGTTDPSAAAANAADPTLPGD